VTSGRKTTSWSIPWAPGTQPAALLSPSAQSTIPALATQAATSGSSSNGAAVIWPVHGPVTQPFGPTSCTLEPAATVDGVSYAHYHDGLDIGAALGTPVRAMAAGTVVFAGTYPDGAVVVRVRHADGSVALYAHLQKNLEVHVGDAVKQGDVLGRVGMTGNTTGPHLHLELTVDGTNIDPLPVLQGGQLPGATAASATAATATATAATTTSAAATATAASWSPASPLAVADGKLTQASLDQFDAIATSVPYHAEIRDAAVRAGVDPLLLASLVRAESGFRATAVSSAGAQGLCQLMPATAKSMGVSDPFDPVQNLRAGARYFANNLELYGRVDLALAAYQAGKGAVASAGGVPDNSTTHHYIDAICSYWTHYREAAT
jgi:biotin carboxyl carrier protein